MKKSLRKRYELIAIILIFVTAFTFLVPTELIRFRNASLFLPPLALLFGIVAGFAVFSLWNEAKTLQDALSEDKAILEQLFSLTELFGKNNVKKLKESINKLLVISVSLGFKDLEKSDKVLKDIMNFFTRIGQVAASLLSQRWCFGKTKFTGYRIPGLFR